MTRKIKITNTKYPITVPNGTIMTVIGMEPNGCVNAVKDGDSFPWFIDAGTFHVLDEPIKLEVGKWYELNNGDVVECDQKNGGVYRMGRWLYEESGVWCLGSDRNPLSVKREVPAPTPEMGTLADLAVKPGDVVVCTYGVFENFITGKEYKARDDGLIEDELENLCDSSISQFRIVSRSSSATNKTPTLWRDMSREEKGALLLAKHEGKAIEVWAVDEWLSPWLSDFIAEGSAYRVKPETVRDTVTMYGNNYAGKIAWTFGLEKDSSDTHKITFDTVDGTPDTSSIRMDPVS